jgi:hypothetical protein
VVTFTAPFDEALDHLRSNATPDRPLVLAGRVCAATASTDAYTR